MCWGAAAIADDNVSKVRVRFKNNGGKAYARCEIHLIYRAAGTDKTKVTFAFFGDMRGEAIAKNPAAHIVKP